MWPAENHIHLVLCCDRQTQKGTLLDEREYQSFTELPAKVMRVHITWILAFIHSQDRAGVYPAGVQEEAEWDMVQRLDLLLQEYFWARWSTMSVPPLVK